MRNHNKSVSCVSNFKIDKSNWSLQSIKAEVSLLFGQFRSGIKVAAAKNEKHKMK